MGSFNINCGITGYNISRDDKVILIPLFMTERTDKPINVYDQVIILPLSLEGEYADCAEISMDDNDINNDALKKLGGLLNRSKYSDFDYEVADFDNLEWNEFFAMVQNSAPFGIGRLSFIAIKKEAFDYVINNYTYSGIIKDHKDYRKTVYGRVNFDIFVKNIKDEQEKMFKEFKKSTKKGMVDFIKDVKYGQYISHPFRFGNFLTPFFTTNESEEVSDEHWNSAFKVLFLGFFFSSTNKPWGESIYASEDFENTGFKILRNILNEVIINDLDNNEGNEELDITKRKLDTEFFETVEKYKSTFKT